MSMPRILKYFNIYNSGNNWRGLAETITLPKLTRKLENYRGAGMNGSAPVDLGLDDEALTVEWSIGGTETLIYEQLGSPDINEVSLRFVGAFEREDTGETNTIEVVMRGRHKEHDPGEYKQGEMTQTKVTTQCTYYKLTIDGTDIVEIDTINFVEKVAGTDRLAKFRNILGL